ncbi:hypothetical protein HanIR_Chr14g0718661 [Helianthus annuus]|nr:hypothetical protein HanIR_Chr14g0718661 [Helianthus annuus]
MLKRFEENSKSRVSFLDIHDSHSHSIIKHIHMFHTTLTGVKCNVLMCKSECKTTNHHQKVVMIMMVHHCGMGHPCVTKGEQLNPFFHHPHPHPHLQINQFHFPLFMQGKPFIKS